MPSRTCIMCSEAPGAVSTPDGWFCRACYREIKRAEADDNPIANAPWCAQCSCLLDGDGFCAACADRATRAAHDKMRRVS